MLDLKSVKQIEQLMDLFRGSEKAHGVFVEAKSVDPLKPKVKGKAITVPQGPTIKQWEEHFQGKVGLGIIPINSNNECYWGVLDVDGELDSNRQLLHNWDCLHKDGSVDHVILQKEIQKQGLPLVCCYSKSKSAHCFLFLEEPIPASAMRSVLEEMSSKLGVGGCEIFPKQDRIDKERGSFGNWLNMPFFGDSRKGVLLDRGKLIEQPIESFLEYAQSKRLTREQFDTLVGDMRIGIDALEDVLVGAPPCLQHILSQGIPVGCRNIVMFNIAVYCRKRFGDNFREEFSKLHDRFIDEPLGFRELESICSSVEGKEYQYQCKDPLLKKYCNANVCIDRDCGIDLSAEIKTLKSATRILTDPFVYAVEVEMEAGLPHTVYVETDQLFNQDLFRKECSYQLKKTFIPIKPTVWNDICVRLINTAVDQEPPFEMTEAGQLFRQLQYYITNKAQYKRTGMSEEEGVYYDKEAHKIYFRLDGFKAYLVRKGVIAQNFSKWKLNQKLSALDIPTGDIDMDTGICKKKPMRVGEEKLKLSRTTVNTKVVSDDDIRIEEMIYIQEEEVV